MNFSSQHVVAACGLIAISASAMADSGVTIYGRIDTSMALTKVGDVRIDRMVNGGSHLGFRGTESLGNGLEVGFQLESAFDIVELTRAAGANGVSRGTVFHVKALDGLIADDDTSALVTEILSEIGRELDVHMMPNELLREFGHLASKLDDSRMVVPYVGAKGRLRSP